MPSCGKWRTNMGEDAARHPLRRRARQPVRVVESRQADGIVYELFGPAPAALAKAARSKSNMTAAPPSS